MTMDTAKDRLLDWMDKAFTEPAIGHGTYLALRPHVKESIAAIESEARAAALREVAERLAQAAYQDRPPTGSRPVPWTPVKRREWTAWANRIAADILTEATDTSGASDG